MKPENENKKLKTLAFIYSTEGATYRKIMDRCRKSPELTFGEKNYVESVHNLNTIEYLASLGVIPAIFVGWKILQRFKNPLYAWRCYAPFAYPLSSMQKEMRKFLKPYSYMEAGAKFMGSIGLGVGISLMLFAAIIRYKELPQLNRRLKIDS